MSLRIGKLHAICNMRSARSFPHYPILTLYSLLYIRIGLRHAVRVMSALNVFALVKMFGQDMPSPGSLS